MANIKSAKKNPCNRQEDARNRRVGSPESNLKKAYDAALEAGDMKQLRKADFSRKEADAGCCKTYDPQERCIQKSLQISKEIQQSERLIFTCPHPCIS